MKLARRNPLKTVKGEGRGGLKRVIEGVNLR
jgi:hypothetical protein